MLLLPGTHLGAERFRTPQRVLSAGLENPRLARMRILLIEDEKKTVMFGVLPEHGAIIPGSYRTGWMSPAQAYLAGSLCLASGVGLVVVDFCRRGNK